MWWLEGNRCNGENEIKMVSRSEGRSAFCSFKQGGQVMGSRGPSLEAVVFSEQHALRR